MSEKDEDFKMIRRTKKSTVCSVSFRNDVLEEVEKSAKQIGVSKSALINTALIEFFAKQKVKEKIEEEKITVDLTGHPLSEQEIQWISDTWFESAGWDGGINHLNRTRPRESVLDKFAANRCYRWYDTLVQCWFERKLWQKMIDHIAKTFPEIRKLRAPVDQPAPERETFFKLPEEVVNELDKVLGVIDKVIDVMWQEKWKAAYDKIIVGDRTFEALCLALDEADSDRIFTIKELAGTLGLTYQQAYKVAPLLIEEGYNIQYRAKES